MTQDQATPGIRKSFGTQLSISVLLVAPFIVLQLVNRWALHEEFPFVLFTFMSLHALLIALLLTPPLHRLYAAGSLSALKPGHWVSLLLGVFLVYVYVNVVIDQLPCFLGVPNCD